MWRRQNIGVLTIRERAGTPNILHQVRANRDPLKSQNRTLLAFTGISLCQATYILSTTISPGLNSITKTHTGGRDCELLYKQWQDFLQLHTHLIIDSITSTIASASDICCTITTTDTETYNRKPQGQCTEMVDHTCYVKTHGQVCLKLSW